MATGPAALPSRARKAENISANDEEVASHPSASVIASRETKVVAESTSRLKTAEAFSNGTAVGKRMVIKRRGCLLKLSTQCPLRVSLLALGSCQQWITSQQDKQK